MKTKHLPHLFGLFLTMSLLLAGLWTLFGQMETAVAGGPWYVNASTGNDGNSCLSVGSPCATVGGAFAKADPGDTINIAAGTYDEALTIDQAVNLLGAGADQTILTNSGGGTAVTIQDGNGNLSQFLVTMQDLAIQDSAGGGLLTLEATELTNVIIQNNSGQGIYNAGTITITNSSINNNVSASSSGAAIINFDIARMTMTDVTISGNVNDNSIVHVQNTAHASLTNVTISGNQTGTALVSAGSAVVTTTNVTIANNTGNGLEDYSGGVAMQNTVIANNETPNCWTTVTSLGNNLESTNTCGFNQASDIVNTEPQLGVLGSNGGDVQTMVPASSSPLIDAGRNDVCPAMDPRGVVRPFDGDGVGANLCDIGAVEYSAVGITSVTIDAPASGNVNTDITINADVLPQTATPPITYTWTATGQSQVVQTSGNSDAVTFNWNSTGLKTITITADNGLAQDSDTVQINIQAGTQALTGVTISGPTSGITGEDVTFTANATPANATQPVTYSWVIQGQNNVTNFSGLSDQITVSWPDDGSYSITVTADNGVNSVQDSHSFTAIEWYVNGSSGNDSNDCTSANAACATVQAALDKASANATIHIAAGTYNEEIGIGQGTTLLGAGTGQTILTNSGGTAVTINDFINNASNLVEMHDLTVANASGEGLTNSDDLTLNNVIIENNGTRGISNVGTLTMTNSTIRGHSGDSGVALFTSGNATLTGVTVSGNSGSSSIVHTQSGGSTSLVNVTISGNSAGTAVLSTSGSTVEILNSTIVNNPGGAMANYATITLQNSILANNGSDNCLTNITSLGNNIEDGNDCNLNQGSDQLNTDPLLNALANNGGPTFTHYPEEGSPAIDTGSNSACPANDQRGETRPMDGDEVGSAICDIGAVEYAGDIQYQLFLPMIIK